LFNYNENDFVVVIAGRLAKEKAHDIFLAAAKKVLETHGNTRFLIIGDGPLRQTLEQLSLQLGISQNILFTGIRSDIPQIYAMADVMVNASYIEGLPMTILEAMAARLPVICTRVGAVPKVIEDQRNGVCIEPGNPDKLAYAIIDLMDNDPKRRQFAESSFKDVCERFSDKSMAHKYLQVYRSLVVPEEGKS
jgi:glycosyltransferase involved in cell wall biosynthesis